MEMETKVEVVESMLVVPSEETPRLGLWLSNFNITASMRYTSLVYYYPAPTTGGEGFFSPERLTAALAKALLLFYPLAGRLGMDEGGRLQIYCRGKGALFVVATADYAGEDIFKNYIPSPIIKRMVIPAAHPPNIMSMFQTEKLKLGSPETPEEGRSKKRRAANVGHYQPDVGPDQFLSIVFKPTFSPLRIPQDFVRWFGEIPSNIIPKTNTGCNWRMTTAREGDDVYIDLGWAAFAIAHQLQVGQFLIFKRVSSFEYSVVIFDYTCTEVMTRCGYHGDATRCVVFESHV